MTSQLASSQDQFVLPSENQWVTLLKRLLRHRIAMVSLVILLVIFGASLLAPLIAPYPRDRIAIDSIRLTPMQREPNGQLHLLGTDHLGRDYFTRLLYAARVSILVAISVSVISTLIGIILGLLAGYFGGWVDTAISRTLEFVSTFPGLTILLIVASILLRNETFIVFPQFVTKSVGFIFAISDREAKQVILIILTLSLLGWTGTARLMRGMTLSVREQPYIEAAQALGVSNTTIMLRHIFPNAAPPMIVDFTLGINGALVGEAALGFLGFGIQDPTPTWGNTLAFAKDYMLVSPWMPLVAGFPILIVSLAINYLGDGLRDATDPRAKV
jgi:peptide/nickel transport system permease protein